MTFQEEKGFFRRREPYNFMLWVAIIGITIMFLGLSLLYLLKVNSDNTENFKLPYVFWLNTFVILTSSFTLHQANIAFKREAFDYYRLLVGGTLFLGLLFTGLQLLGWQYLQSMEVFLNKNLSGAFLYVISGLHLAHILGGIVFLVILFIESLKNKSYVSSFVYSVNPPNQLRLKLVTNYWHFVDILWVYLFLFFLFHH